MILLKLTLRSLWNRRASLLLTLISIAISVLLLLGVDYIRKEARNSFFSTISGTDLVVGARSGPVQLLLYLGMLAVVVVLALVFSLIPGAIAYRCSLQDGLTVRV